MTVAQVAQRGGGYFGGLGDIQGQAGWGSEQPDFTVGVSAHCRRVGVKVPPMILHLCALNLSYVILSTWVWCKELK